MSIIHRPMRHGDREAVIGLLMQLAAHEAALSPTRASGPATAQALLEADSAQTRDRAGAQFVAELAGTCIGYLALRLGHTGPYVHDDLRDHVLIENIVVDAGRRGTGVGQMLLAQAERFARDNGCKALQLGVLTGNDPALTAYRRAGFESLSIEMIKRLD
ncbi:MAG: GNAT family N-acetyltransferase [Bosea sp. (in: a-proteobacteria)]|uniref:GNAT family N-acetyltransferase n=1 Tax=Bosea sp. (in: a-proteobacteria) TaxID=1871050 RepID=UPI002734EB4D|nr:GNAT family N-acetyltransferase [Bosea sp. (in: a-proteobacteria)]MDP3257305.1 GNAT family N-acetyltransferase [Bosea sp. (in: a-proteobacteria)]MDP3317886.1 GNAT family N-acetyltransferase [Bosea sp. (in: a-proteobacteria)]